MRSAARVLARLSTPLRLLDRRSTLVERLIDAEMGEVDFDAVQAVCDAQPCRVGVFYHWYLQKFLVRRAVRGLDRRRALALVRSVDRTDYAALDRRLPSRGGVLAAIPHHGHYVLAIVALAEHLRRTRPVLVFYGEPSTHRGNEVFDALHGVLYAGVPGVEVIHDTRQGLGRALRGLKDGAAVIIMPDATKNPDDTVPLPFAGRWVNVMLGSAVLARKTAAPVIPMVARQAGAGMGFATVAGAPLVHPLADGEAVDARLAPDLDYRLTRELFACFEREMLPDLVQWQFARQHLLQPKAIIPASREALEAVAMSVAMDPALAPPSAIVDLRGA